MKKNIYIFLFAISLSITTQTTLPFRVKTYSLCFEDLASFESLAVYIRKIDSNFVALQGGDCKTNRKLAPLQNGKDFIST